MSFDAVRGQEAAVRMLRAALRHDRVASAYLFFGPEGVGKRRTAGELAGALLCPEGPDRGGACRSCPACTRWAAGTHPGLLEVVLLPERTLIGIEQIQDLGARLSLRPFEGERTVAIIDEAHRSSLEALNALLKTLEEPAPGVTLILVTSSREALPETIRSRCQGIRFRPLPPALVRELLVEHDGVEAEEADLLARIAGGSLGRARRLRELGMAESLRPLLEGGAGPPELSLGRDRQENREKVEALLRTLLERLRGELARHASETASIEREVRRVVTSLLRLRVNVSPEAILSALAAAEPRSESAGG